MHERYDLLRRIVEHAAAAVHAETRLATPGPLDPIDEPWRVVFGPPNAADDTRHRVEMQFARAAFHCRQCLAEYNALPALPGIHHQPLSAGRALRRLDRFLKARLDPWGLDDQLVAAGPAVVNARYIKRRDALVKPLIDAAASWRLNDDDADDDDLADKFASLASTRRVEPTMTPDAGRDAYPKLLRAWRESPLLDEPAGADDDARRELRKTTDVIRKYFESIVPPSGIAEIVEQEALLLLDRESSAVETDGRPLPVASIEPPTAAPEPPTAPAVKPRKGTRPHVNVEADRRIVEAWESGLYGDYLALADHLGISKAEVKRAIDRERKRRKK